MRKKELERERAPAEEKDRRSRHRSGQDGPVPNVLSHVQKAVGNQALSNLVEAGIVKPKLRISQSRDPDETEADRLAERVVQGQPAAPASRTAAESIQRDDATADRLHDAFPLVEKALHSSGQPLDAAIRAEMEPRFGHDFSRVRVHTGTDAASSAKQVNARAFTLGGHIVFGAGEAPARSGSGARLLAHELAHVVQNQRSGESGSGSSSGRAVIKRESLVGEAKSFFSEKTAAAGKWVDEKKWAIYRAIIAGMKTAKTATINQMRGLVPKLSGGLQGPVSGIIDVVDFIMDLINALALAIIGLAVGFVEGIAGLITGLVKLALGFIKLVVDWLVALMGRSEEYQQDINEIAAAVKGIPAGLTRLKDQWIQRYQHATLEEQVLMGGELVGEIEAFLATFAFAGTKAGQATTITVRTGDVGMQLAAKGSVAALERAPAVTVTIPAVVPKTAAEAAVVSSQMMMSASGSGGGGGKPRVRNKAAADRFLREQLQKISDPKHPLHFLVEPKLNAEGKPLTSAEGNPLFDWRKTTRTTESGKVQVGRYQANESGVTVQVGHQSAFTSGAPERFMLEDADLNQLSGQVIESKGAFSFKPAVDIEGVPVEMQSAEQWERLELLPKGTVAKSPRLAAPDL